MSGRPLNSCLTEFQWITTPRISTPIRSPSTPNLPIASAVCQTALPPTRHSPRVSITRRKPATIATPPPNNTGLYEITHEATDMGRFRAPTLRNIELTAPYMHDGSVTTLAEAIAHYKAGGRTIDSGNYAGVGRDNPLKSHFISGFELTEQEKQDLLAFLRSLTDETLIHNPAFSDPHQMP